MPSIYLFKIIWLYKKHYFIQCAIGHNHQILVIMTNTAIMIIKINDYLRSKSWTWCRLYGNSL